MPVVIVVLLYWRSVAKIENWEPYAGTVLSGASGCAQEKRKGARPNKPPVSKNVKYFRTQVKNPRQNLRQVQQNCGHERLALMAIAHRKNGRLGTLRTSQWCARSFTGTDTVENDRVPNTTPASKV